MSKILEFRLQEEQGSNEQCKWSWMNNNDRYKWFPRTFFSIRIGKSDVFCNSMPYILSKLFLKMMRVLILFSAVFSKTHDFEIKRLQTRCTYLLMSASSLSSCFLREQHITSKQPNPKKFCSGFLSSSYGFGSTWMASKYAILVFTVGPPESSLQRL